MAAFDVTTQPTVLIGDPAASPSQQFVRAFSPDVVAACLASLGVLDSLLEQDTAPANTLGAWFQRDQATTPKPGKGTNASGSLFINLNEGAGWEPATAVLFAKLIARLSGLEPRVDALEVGGTTPPSQALTDYNLATRGTWYLSPAAANGPEALPFYLLCIEYPSGPLDQVQIAYGYSSDVVWMRRRIGGTFSAWAQIDATAAGRSRTISDANNAARGTWYVSSLGSSVPHSGSAWYLSVIEYPTGPDDQVQIAYGYSVNEVWMRRRIGGGPFSSWVQVNGSGGGGGDPAASQAEVNVGTETAKYVSPSTLTNRTPTATEARAIVNSIQGDPTAINDLLSSMGGGGTVGSSKAITEDYTGVDRITVDMGDPGDAGFTFSAVGGGRMNATGANTYQLYISLDGGASFAAITSALTGGIMRTGGAMPFGHVSGTWQVQFARGEAAAVEVANVARVAGTNVKLQLRRAAGAVDLTPANSYFRATRLS